MIKRKKIDSLAVQHSLITLILRWSDGGSSEYSEKLGEELLKLVQKFEHKIIHTKMADDNNAIVSVENHHISD